MADLNIVQNERLTIAFRYRIDGVGEPLTDWEWRGQVRKSEKTSSSLILDLEPYLQLDDEDDTLLVLDVPATVTATISRLSSTAAWDIFIWPAGQPEDTMLLVEGVALLNPAATLIATV